MKKASIFAIALLLAALLPLEAGVEAQSPPHVFVGEAMLDGVVVPDGTVIQAVLDGQPIPGAKATAQDGKFTLIVEQPAQGGAAGAMIGFGVGGFLARQSQPWELGNITLLTLTASSILPSIPVEIHPPLPARLIRGEEFLITIKADTGIYQATGGEVRVGFDPQVFIPDLQRVPPATGRTQNIAVSPESLQVDWTYDVPTSTAGQEGELFSIPLRVRGSAPTGSTSLAFQVALAGPGSQPFPVEPSRFSADVKVVRLAADFNGDDLVDVADLAALGSVWGRRRGEPRFQASFDLDGDGTIWIGDLVILVQSYRSDNGDIP